MSRAFDRRTLLKGVLKGTAVSVALPLLENMLNAGGTAYADGGALPKRFVLWFWGNGVRRAHWIPSEVGEHWSAPTELAPLVAEPALVPYLAPLTGFEIKTDTHPHHSGMAGMLSGAKYHLLGPVRDTIASTFAEPSIDQVIADSIARDPTNVTPYRSLEVGVCRFRGSDEGTTFQHLSHNGPNNVNPSEYEPINVFNRLFGVPDTRRQDAVDRSVLDAVLGDIDALKKKVGAADRMRLDQHFESVRAIEMRIGGVPLSCTSSRPLDEYPDRNGDEQIAEKNAIMSELVAMALACDLTRIASVCFTTAGAGTIYWQVGALNSMHQMCHDERVSGPELQPTVHAAAVFEMQQLAVFLNTLRTTTSGAGNLLDQSVVLATTELSEGLTHSNDEFPIIVAGKGAGALRTGRHIRSNDRANTSNVLLTLLRAMGDPRTSFGVDAGATTEVVSELLA